MVNLRAKEAEKAAQMFKRQKQQLFEGNDNMFFDAKEYHAANKNVANILQSDNRDAVPEQANLNVKVEEATLENLEDAAWGEADGIDIDMGDDILAQEGAGATGGDPFLDGDATTMDTDIFVPPSAGADPLKQALKKNPHSVGLHIASGEFAKAIELLRK